MEQIGKDPRRRPPGRGHGNGGNGGSNNGGGNGGRSNSSMSIYTNSDAIGSSTIPREAVLQASTADVSDGSRVPSPRDRTPITVEGVEIKREDLPPIPVPSSIPVHSSIPVQSPQTPNSGPNNGSPNSRNPNSGRNSPNSRNPNSGRNSPNNGRQSAAEINLNNENVIIDMTTETESQVSQSESQESQVSQSQVSQSQVSQSGSVSETRTETPEEPRQHEQRQQEPHPQEAPRSEQVRSRPRSPRDAVPNLIEVISTSPRNSPPVRDFQPEQRPERQRSRSRSRSSPVAAQPIQGIQRQGQGSQRQEESSVNLSDLPTFAPISPRNMNIDPMSSTIDPSLRPPRQTIISGRPATDPSNRSFINVRSRGLDTGGDRPEGRRPGSGRPGPERERGRPRSRNHETGRHAPPQESEPDQPHIQLRVPGSLLSDDKYLEYDELPPRKQTEIRDEYRIRFNMLRRANGGIEIPQIDPVDHLSSIVKRYDQTVRYIMICGKANSYRIALVLYWLGLEVIAIKVFGLNASGFTIYQFRAMNQYDALLIELGEKNMDSRFDQWPVEMRIIILGLVHLVIFIIAQIFASWIGPNMAPTIIGILQQLLTGPAVDSNGVPASGGFDFANMLANFGSAFVGNPGNLGNTNTGQTANATATSGVSGERREFRPRFEE